MSLSIDPKLDAVNQILNGIGESPVNSIEDPTNVDVINALQMLERTNRKIQRKGYVFNTVEKYTLNPDFFTKKISWNPNIIKLTSPNDRKIYTKRGDYLYDLTNQTGNFTEPVVVTAVLLIDFEDLPEAAQGYIVAKTAFDFQVLYSGDELSTQKLQVDLKEAWEDFSAYILELEMTNIFENSSVLEIMGGRS
ncbi:hypothetical protein SPFL3102_03580 [Sporomusaceae bacterium FL31]|nr:hypothetical protein SPFL3101_00425 [Sporomusaceae bacterium FL31]GCE35729.1 hypothetical protein SPFL3102_03580 [Sporomusaceae bacterium]